jgi:cytochrome c-type biogenesis protein CcmH/NrfF
MPNLKKLKAVALVVLATALCIGQSANDYEDPSVVHIAGKLNCNCGCHLNMACVMPPSGVCPVCRENKIRISNMLKQGMSEQQILDQYVKDQGQQVLVVSPGVFGFTGPYIALGIGMLAVLFVIRRLKHTKPAPVAAPASDAELARYQDQIEKDLAKFD